MKSKDSPHQSSAALIAHELRRPVGVIRGYASMLADGSLKNHPLHSVQAAQKIIEHGDGMEALLNALATALTGRDRREIIDLRATVRLACQQMKDRIELEKAVLSVVGADEQMEPIWALANQAHILCILTGLIGNALFYSLQPAKVVVRLLERDTQTEIEVQDYGIGIPEPDRIHLFEHGHRASDKTNRLGLGLSLSQEMAGLNEGNLRLKSSELGKGSTFVLALPRVTQADVAKIERLRQVKGASEKKFTSSLSSSISYADSNSKRDSKVRNKKPVGLPLADLIYLRRRQMGLTQEKLAMRLHRIAESSGSWSGATAQLINRYETGTIPRSDSLEWLAEALDLSTEAIKEQARQQNALSKSANSPQINNHSASEVMINSGGGDEEVKRREFASVGLGALGIIPGMDLERLQAALSGSLVDEQSLDQLRVVTDGLMQKSWNAEPRSLLPLVTNHFSNFGTMLFRVPAKLSSRALSIAGEMAFLAGYLSLKSGLSKNADFYWESSEWMAKAAGNTNLQVILFTVRGWQARDYGQLEKAVKNTERAQSLLGKNPNPALAALVYSSLSYELTDKGEEQAVAQHLDTADRYLKQLPRDDSSIYTLETVREEVAGARGWYLLNIGQHSEAANTFEQMLGRINPTWTSWQSIAKAELGCIYAKQGNIEQAAHTFSSAWRTAQEAEATRYQQYTFRLRQQWVGNNDSPVVRRLDEEFASSLS